MFFRALASHRILFDAAGVSWAAGIATMVLDRPWAYVILFAALALTIIGGQRRMAARWQEQHASEFRAFEEANIEQVMANQKLADALLELAGSALSQRGLRETGARRILHAVEDARSEPAG